MHLFQTASLESKVSKDELFLRYSFFPTALLDIKNKFRFQCTIFAYASAKSILNPYQIHGCRSRSRFHDLFFRWSRGCHSLSLSASMLLLSLIAVLELILHSLFLLLHKFRCCSNPIFVLNVPADVRYGKRNVAKFNKIKM